MITKILTITMICLTITMGLKAQGRFLEDFVAPEFNFIARTWDGISADNGFKLKDDEALPVCKCPLNSQYKLKYNDLARVHNNRLLNMNFKRPICIPLDQTELDKHTALLVTGNTCVKNENGGASAVNSELYCVKTETSLAIHVPNFFLTGGATMNSNSCTVDSGTSCGYIEPQCKCPTGYAPYFGKGANAATSVEDAFLSTVNNGVGSYVYKGFVCRKIGDNLNPEKWCDEGYKCQRNPEGGAESDSEGVCKDGFSCQKYKDGVCRNGCRDCNPKAFDYKGEQVTQVIERKVIRKRCNNLVTNVRLAKTLLNGDVRVVKTRTVSSIDQRGVCTTQA